MFEQAIKIETLDTDAFKKFYVNKREFDKFVKQELTESDLMRIMLRTLDSLSSEQIEHLHTEAQQSNLKFTSHLQSVIVLALVDVELAN
jgi:hypothetical protein